MHNLINGRSGRNISIYLNPLKNVDLQDYDGFWIFANGESKNNIGAIIVNKFTLLPPKSSKISPTENPPTFSVTKHLNISQNEPEIVHYNIFDNKYDILEVFLLFYNVELTT